MKANRALEQSQRPIKHKTPECIRHRSDAVLWFKYVFVPGTLNHSIFGANKILNMVKVWGQFLYTFACIGYKWKYTNFCPNTLFGFWLKLFFFLHLKVTKQYNFSRAHKKYSIIFCSIDHLKKFWITRHHHSLIGSTRLESPSHFLLFGILLLFTGMTLSMTMTMTFALMSRDGPLAKYFQP